MAQELGLKRHWYHKGKFPHYDIPVKRISEIQEKCQVVTSKELLNIIKENSNV